MSDISPDHGHDGEDSDTQGSRSEGPGAFDDQPTPAGGADAVPDKTGGSAGGEEAEQTEQD